MAVIATFRTPAKKTVQVHDNLMSHSWNCTGCGARRTFLDKATAQRQGYDHAINCRKHLF
ncbi:hypothetical protein P3T37_002243 [Kitasatospora sp. MAA4]|uniref:hypothetical protein n=1 Tax=Kitasatospora sp. MAA4 TaxID=3035093 RepID=UPI0024771515|nr:hypothetical protein [Kitasatospora sp. MAA4]MDH6132857.1 hypothetical protein [Kitasatospora sp. MAA4]